MFKEPDKSALHTEPLFNKLGWLITFGAIPFGSCLPGLPFLLISRIHSRFRGKNIAHPEGKNSLSNLTIKMFYVFWAIMLFSSAISLYRWISLPQSLGFGLLLYIFMFGGRHFGSLNEDLLTRKCLPIMAIGSVLAVIISLIRFFFFDNTYRSVDLFTSWNGFGTILIIVGGLTIAFLNWRGDKWVYAIIPYLVLAFAALITTKSRGGWFGFLTMLGCLTLFNRKTLIILLITILLLSGIFFLFPSIQSRFLSSFSTEQNISRVFIWRSTLNMIKDHPFLGVGTGIFPVIYHQYALPNAPEKQVSFAHNLFLQVLAEFGLVGLVCFCGILFLVLLMSFRLAKTGHLIYQGIFAVIIGVLVHQQVDIPIWGFDIGGAFWMLVGLTIGLYESHEVKNV